MYDRRYKHHNKEPVFIYLRTGRALTTVAWRTTHCFHGHLLINYLGEAEVR